MGKVLDIKTKKTFPNQLQPGDKFKVAEKDFAIYKLIDTDQLKNNRTLLTFGSEYYRGNDQIMIIENFKQLFKII